MSVIDAVRDRTSWSKVTDQAPTREQLVEMVEAAGRVADHSSLRPWRLIELRGADRERLGAAIAEAQGDDVPSSKPLRAPLLIAVVARHRPSGKVPYWEQEAVASGVAHMLSLLLDDAGWGVIWRTGHYTRSAAVAKAHGLGDDEQLLGWLYVGGKPAGKSAGRRKSVEGESVLDRMPTGDGDIARPAPKKLSKKQAKKARKKAAKRAKKAAKKAAKRADGA
ncbi:nitroreductase family protein [Microbacterium sp. Mu-43]|uniref:Nitroreductase family protein n=1 Tax=Microbacterium istanbulense TaxID=3122049 RepID=A0ABU8LLZ6_9MICO